MGKVWLSATQIEVYGLAPDAPGSCRRKWGFKNIARIAAPPNRFAERGIDLHTVAEEFLRDGKPIPDTDAGKVFRAGIPYLPVPGTCAVEGWFEWLPEGEPFGIRGRIDVWEPALFRVDDHKTTTDFRWAKSAEDLRDGVQSSIYLLYKAMQADPPPQGMLGRWIYYLWNPDRPRAKAVDFSVPVDHLLRNWGRIAETAREMAAVPANTEPKDLEFNTATCGAYGGCPYRDVCGLTGQERMRSFMTQMTLKEKMAQRAAQAPAINPPESKAPVVVAPAQATLPMATTPGMATFPGLVPATLPDGRVVMIPAPAATVTIKPATVPAAKPAPKAGPDYKALAEACVKIAEGFAAIASHFKGM